MQEFEMTVKDEFGDEHKYKYHKFDWTEGAPLMIYRAKAEWEDVIADGATLKRAECTLIGMFRNFSSLPEIKEVEDESES